MKITKYLEYNRFRLEATIESKDTNTHSAMSELSLNDLAFVKDDLNDLLDEFVKILKHKETKSHVMDR